MINYSQHYQGTDWAEYSNIPLSEIINNFLMIYVGEGKVINKVNREDVIFHAKRGVQEFNYDILRPTTSIELEVPHNLYLPFPPDYVDYINLHKLGDDGRVMRMYLSSDKRVVHESPLQSYEGIPIQDNEGEDIQSESVSSIKLKENKPAKISHLEGDFMIDDKTGRFLFNSDMIGEHVVIEYLSDGMCNPMGLRVPKITEEAMYAYITYAIISSRANTQEYIVKRYQKEKRAKMRNAKLRLSSISSRDLLRLMRGKSQQLKY